MNSVDFANSIRNDAGKIMWVEQPARKPLHLDWNKVRCAWCAPKWQECFQKLFA